MFGLTNAQGVTWPDFQTELNGYNHTLWENLREELLPRTIAAISANNPQSEVWYISPERNGLSSILKSTAATTACYTLPQKESGAAATAAAFMILSAALRLL